ncbi:MAG: DUF4160 domain-containing protein [Tannerella sp.]|jgi:hypothetical protein|nr:DUF4160 domain-containing protein [Tannerella sp.]
MPTLFIVFGLRFYFYSEEHLPIHVHVQKGRGKAKFKIDPEVEFVESKGLKVQEISLAKSIVEENKELIMAQWRKHFENSSKS